MAHFLVDIHTALFCKCCPIKTATIGITIIAIKFKMSLHSIFSSSKLHPFAISDSPFFSKLLAFYRFRQPYFSVVQVRMRQYQPYIILFINAFSRDNNTKQMPIAASNSAAYPFESPDKPDILFTPMLICSETDINSVICPVFKNKSPAKDAVTVPST